MMRFKVRRLHDEVEVGILPHKDGSGYSFINFTKGHICPCKFKSVDEAIWDMVNNEKVKDFIKIGD